MDYTLTPSTPYRALISSLLHKFVNGRLIKKIRD